MHLNYPIDTLRGGGADAALWKIKKIGVVNCKLLVVKVNGLSWAKISLKMADFCLFNNGILLKIARSFSNLVDRTKLSLQIILMG